MTITKGMPWGRSGTVPSDAIVASSDADVASAPDGRVIVSTGGDLWNALGRPHAGRPGNACTIVDIDALVCTVEHADSSTSVMRAASNVRTGSWFRPGRRHVCITNAGIVGGLNLAPRAHPNDGRFDVFEMTAEMPWRQRLVARRRAGSGTHVPHPDITVRQATTIDLRRARSSERLSVDGRTIDDWVGVTVTIDPDRWQLAV